MNKQIKKVLLSLLAAGCALSVAACAKTKTLTKEEAEAQLDGFTLPDNITQEVGSEYAVPSLAVFGEGGVEYSASVSASCGGKEVKIVDGKIKLDEVREYTLTYTVEYKGYTFIKTMSVGVTDTGKPIVSIKGTTAKHKVNEETSLPEYEIFEIGGIQSETVEIYDPAGNKTDGSDGKFTPSMRGKYRMVVKATDTSGNTAEAETFFYVSGDRSEFDAVENFEEGMNENFLFGEGLDFHLKETDGNSYASVSLGNMWPHVVFDKDAFKGYMAKGYDQLHLSLWGSNESSHLFYYEKAPDTYVYGELNKGVKTEFFIPAADLEYMLGNDGIFELIFLNDNPNETVDLNIDDIYGVFTGETLKQQTAYDVSALAESTIPGVGILSYKAYKDGELAAQGNASDKFTPQEDGKYIVEFPLSDNRGTARIFCNVVTAADSIGFETGTSSALEFKECSAELSEAHATEGAKSLKLSVSVSQGYPTIKISRYFLENVFANSEALAFDVFLDCTVAHDGYYEYAAGKYEYFHHESASALTVVIKKEALDFLRSANMEFLEYVIINVDAVNESFSFYIDNFRGMEIREDAYYISQTDSFKITAQGIKKIYLNGEDITLHAKIGESGAELSAQILKDLTGLNTMIVTAESGESICKLEVIGDKLSFEDGNLTSALSFSEVEKVNVALDFPSDGTKSLHLVISQNAGFPKIKIDRRFLENVFANTEADVLCFEVRAYLAQKAHEGYYEYGEGADYHVDRFTIQPNQTMTISVKREALEYLKAGQKTTLDIVILNSDSMNEPFELFLDNFRGVKQIAEETTVYVCEGAEFQIEGAKGVMINGTDVTAETILSQNSVKLPSALLKKFSETLMVIVSTDGTSALYTLNVIGDKLSFEDGKLTSALSFSEVEKVNVALDFPSDGTKSLHLVISQNAGFPKIKIDRRFLENVFANTEADVLCFEVRAYLAQKAHEGYYEYGEGADYHVDRFTIQPNQTMTISVKREALEYLKAGQKTTLDIVILNSDSMNEPFELFLDNFRGEKAA